MAHSRDQKLYFSLLESQSKLIQYTLDNKQQITSLKANDGNHPFSWQYFINHSKVLKKLQDKMGDLLKAFNGQGQLEDADQFDAINQKINLLDRLRMMESDFVSALTRFYPNGTKKADFNPKQFISHLACIFNLNDYQLTEKGGYAIKEMVFTYCKFIGGKITAFTEVNDINEKELNQLERDITTLRLFSIDCAGDSDHPQNGFFRELIRINYSRKRCSHELLEELDENTMHFFGHAFPANSKKLKNDLIFSNPEMFGKVLRQMHYDIAMLMKQYAENTVLLKKKVNNLGQRIWLSWDSKEKQSQFKLNPFEKPEDYISLYLKHILPHWFQAALHLDGKEFADLIETHQFDKTGQYVNQLTGKIKSILNILNFVNEKKFFRTCAKYDDAILDSARVLFDMFLKEEVDNFLKLTALNTKLDETQYTFVGDKKLDSSCEPESIELIEQRKLSFAFQVMEIFYNIHTAGNIIRVSYMKYHYQKDYDEERAKKNMLVAKGLAKILKRCGNDIDAYLEAPYSDEAAKKQAQEILLSYLYRLRDEAIQSFNEYEQWLIKINKWSVLSGSTMHTLFQLAKKEAISVSQLPQQGPSANKVER